MAEGITLLTKLEGRLTGLRQDRYSWWVHWSELARYILPRRYRWLVTPNQWNRGEAINGAIIDSTGTIAARVLASGMMSGITSPTRPWFKLRMEGYEPDEVNPVNIWLAICERRMMRVFQESNFYNCIAVMYSDLGVFGTAPMFIHEDFENVIRCENPCAGEYYVAINEALFVNVLYREIIMTVSQLVQKFGEANCSKNVQEMYKRGQNELQQEILVCHAIEPNHSGTGVPRNFAFFEAYWEKGNARNAEGMAGERFLRKRGYFEFPGICPRWDVTGNDAYGRSPGMDALGDIKQLQQETKRKAQAVDKLANPPMVADIELQNKPASTLPGGVTYITKKDGAGFKPAYENFRPPIAELSEDLFKVQERIKGIFFNDLFLMISSLETVRTATEIDARREEKLVMLGPVLERLQTEALDPVIDRTFAIMNRAGLFPPAPPEIQGKPIQVEYVSMLAQAQRAVATAGIERWLATIGNMAAIDPTVVDNVSVDRTARAYGGFLAVPPDLMTTDEERRTIRENRRKQQEQQAQVEITKEGVDAAHTLSQTPVGGGKQALEAMLNPGAVSA